MEDNRNMIVPHGWGLDFIFPGAPGGADTLCLDGMAPDFTYAPLADFQPELKTFRARDAKYLDCAGFRLRYLRDGYTVQEYDNIRNPNYGRKLRRLKLAACSSYGGRTAVGIRDTVPYDLYLLYKAQGPYRTLVAESADDVIPGLDVRSGAVLCAEGYTRSPDGSLELAGTSGDCGIDVRSRRDMPENPTVSIVVPVYNNRHFLARALDSLVLQSESAIEIVCVDDGSTDPETARILDWYCAGYGCVKLLRQPGNEGIASARNKGVLAARGRYIAFLDSDDTAHPDFYRRLRSALEAHGADIAIGQVLARRAGGSELILAGPDGGPEITYSYEEMAAARGTDRNIYFMAVWNKLARAETVRKVFFPDSCHGYDGRTLYEDMAYTPALYSYADRFVFVKDARMAWEQRNRDTVGTASTGVLGQPAQDQAASWRCAFEAVFFPLERGNRDRFDFLARQAALEMVRKYDSLLRGDPPAKLVADMSALCRASAAKHGLDKAASVAADPALLARVRDIIGEEGGKA